MKKCPKCGLIGCGEAKFCPTCGQAMIDAPAGEIPAAPQVPVNEIPAPPTAPTAPATPPVAPPTAPAASQTTKSGIEGTVKNITDTPDTTSEYAPEDIRDNTVMAVLSYIGILVLVPMFAAKESKFARFHANQGLTLFIAEAAYGVVTWLLKKIIWLIVYSWAGWIYTVIATVLSLIGVVFAVLALFGIINVANGKAKELPVLGKFRLLK